jgi:hypothetical protein
MVTNFTLNNLANNFRNMVAGVVLNSDIEITNFELNQVSANVYTLQFLVPNGVQEIRQLQLQDNEQRQLASYNLFVQIATNANFKYVLTIENAR